MEAYSTAGGRYSQIPTAMWIKRPKGQLAKCGKAASLRTAFPEECGYAAEEMDGKSLDDLNDANEAAVLDGQATPVDTGSGLTESVQVIDLSLIDAKVQKAVTEMVRRTTLAGAWQAAYDYANNKFSGLDLTFAIAELDKASAAHQSASSSLEQAIEGAEMPLVTPVKEALNQARETLGSLRN